MRSLFRNALLGLRLATMALAVACTGSPVSPSPGAAAVTTIRGNLFAPGTTASASRLAATVDTTIRVCISGTDTCDDVDGAGNFELTGNFTGDIRLRFTGAMGEVTLTIPDVRHGETIVVKVELDGTTGVVRVESRSGGDDDDSADDDSLDDDSADDDSADDDSADDLSEDDDSRD